MAWFDELHLDGKGSWRGIEFFVDSHDNVLGRKVVLHEYPGRDQPYAEDIGRASRRFKLTCYVLGNDYNVDRDDLLREFETSGPGQLVHPTLGEFQCVIVSPVSMKEAPQEGGIARFDLELVEVGSAGLTISFADVANEVNVDADTAGDALAEEFSDSFSVIGAINSVRTAAVGAISTLNNTLAQGRAVVNTALAVADDVGSAIQSVAQNAASLILAPIALAQAVRGVVTGAFSAVATLDSALSDLISAGGQALAAVESNIFGDFRAKHAKDLINTMAVAGSDIAPPNDNTSDQGTIQSKNQASLINLYRKMSVIEGARNATQLEYESRDAVIDMSDTVSQLLSDAATDAGDELWAALADLRDSFTRRMAQLAEELPALVEHIPQETRPCLCIAYDIHDDATRETEIIGRNNLSDPNFVRALIPIKVIVDV